MALSSTVLHKWPYLPRSYTNGLILHGLTQMALSSTVLHKWPYLPRSYTNGLILHGLTQIALSSTVLHKWPYLPRSYTNFALVCLLFKSSVNVFQRPRMLFASLIFRSLSSSINSALSSMQLWPELQTLNRSLAIFNLNSVQRPVLFCVFVQPSRKVSWKYFIRFTGWFLKVKQSLYVQHNLIQTLSPLRSAKRSNNTNP
jgi:hypothetical protein